MTSRPALLRVLAASALLGGMLGACGAGGTSGRADTLKTTTSRGQEGTTTTNRQSSFDPKAAVLTLDDMPTGYSVGEDSSSSDDALKGCPQLEALDADTTQPVAKAEAQFQAGQLGPFIQHEVAVSEKGKAHDEFAKLRSAVDAPGCQSFSQPTDNGTATYRLGPLSVPRLGDETFALRLTGDKAAYNVTLDLVAERIGDSVSVLVVATVPLLGGPAPALDPLAHRADEKLKAA
jgi:hypothetical protein